MARALKGQLTLPTPNRIGIKRSPDELYGDEYGRDKLEQQQALYVEARRCTCPPPANPETETFPEKWGRQYGHKSPCPRAGKRF